MEQAGDVADRALITGKPSPRSSGATRVDRGSRIGNGIFPSARGRIQSRESTLGVLKLRHATC